jgi:hypothetical protein
LIYHVAGTKCSLSSITTVHVISSSIQSAISTFIQIGLSQASNVPIAQSSQLTHITTKSHVRQAHSFAQSNVITSSITTSHETTPKSFAFALVL